jgi:hypothetical protein
LKFAYFLGISALGRNPIQNPNFETILCASGALPLSPLSGITETAAMISRRRGMFRIGSEQSHTSFANVPRSDRFVKHYRKEIFRWNEGQNWAT